MSYTLARLPVPAAVWDLIADKLRAAGYDHVFHGGTIDLTHIGLEVEPPRSEPVTDRVDNLIAWRMGEACAHASDGRAGDPIDRGLMLLRELVARGLDVVVSDARGASYRPAVTVRAAAPDLMPLSMPLGAALVDPRITRGTHWIRSRIATTIATHNPRFEEWQFRIAAPLADCKAEARFYNPDRDLGDGVAVPGWRPWRPAAEFGMEQLRQIVTIIPPTDGRP